MKVDKRVRAVKLEKAEKPKRLGTSPSPGRETKILTPPLLPVEPGALTNTSGGGSAGVQQHSTRPRAPWWQASVDIAQRALKSGGADPAAVVRAVLEDPAVGGAKLSVVVLGSDGAPLVDIDGAVARNPCSNAKVITAAWALSTLGPNHRFKTSFLLAADGALVVRGSFDPTLTSDALRALIVDVATGLKARGIHTLPRVVIDTSPLSGSNVPASFSRYQDEDWEYLSRPEPFSVDKNLLRLTIMPGPTPGAPATVTVDSTAFSVQSQAITIDGKTEFKLGCDEHDSGGVLQRDDTGKPVIAVWGNIAADYAKGKTLVMKSPAPLEQAGAAVASAFASAGIAVESVTSEQVGEPAGVALHTLHTHQSKPLATILQTSLATSNAFDHEMIALATAQHAGGGPVTLQHTAAQLTQFLRGLGVDGVLVNASGIGNDSRVPAQAIAKILLRARTDPKLHSLLGSLSTPGGVGTLKTRMVDTEAESRFAGKTGTGDDAVALSGVAGGFVMSAIVDDMKSKRDSVRAVLDALAIALSALSAAQR